MNKDLSADGLRGIAAVSVFLAHFILAFFPLALAHFYPWVAAPTAIDSISERMLRLPFICALWNGSFAVAFFFILSGYVLTTAYRSTGNIGIIRLLAARRYFRLGIPVFVSVMFAYSLNCAGAYENTAAAEITKSIWLQSQGGVHAAFVDALRDGLYGVVLQGHTQFNTVFWSMRVEFTGSMLIFSYVLLAWPGRREILMTLVFIASIVFFAPSEWPFYLAFLIGSFLGSVELRLNKWGRTRAAWCLCISRAQMHRSYSGH